MTHHLYRRLVALVGGTACLAVAGACGGDDESNSNQGAPPEASNPEVTCERVDDDGIEGPVVQEVSLRIQDPDRDLQTDEGRIEGTIDGIFVSFSDSDADGRFTWEAAPEYNPLRCDGQFRIVVSPSDQKGNSKQYTRKVIKEGGNSSK